MPETTKARKTPAKPRKTAAKSKSATREIAENKTVAINHDDVRKLAHQFWIDGGHREGHHHEDWARAEAELRRRAS